MSSEQPYVIDIENLSKNYFVFKRPWHRLLKALVDTTAASIYTKDDNFLKRFSNRLGKQISVLDNISLRIEKGRFFGLIGKNGAGKSTLLQIICGTLQPSAGKVRVRGKIAALLELGSGFNPQFTGRENVYFNARLLGLSQKEIDAKFNDIAQFADIGEFIDQEVSTYSSGMFVRLAFAVIAHVNAEILVIDEALAVGDVFFQQKCLRFLKEFRLSGGTIILVTHDTASITSLCDEAALIYPGAKHAPLVGEPDMVVKRYLAERYSDQPERASEQVKVKPFVELTPQYTQVRGAIQPSARYHFQPFRSDAESFGDGGGKIIDAWLENEFKERISTASSGQMVNLIIVVTVNSFVSAPAFGLMIKDRQGQFVFTESSDLSFRDIPIQLQPSNSMRVCFSFKLPTLVVGNYTINLAFADGLADENTQLHWIHDAIAFTCLSSRLIHGICGLDDFEAAIQRLPDVIHG
jgi:lipopolysaccharide transport system ATP-binding protein